jgi:hypothetical protein
LLPHVIRGPPSPRACMLACFALCSVASTSADFRCRSQYSAMIALLDEIMGNITAALQAKGLWSDTLMVVSRCVVVLVRKGGC